MCGCFRVFLIRIEARVRGFLSHLATPDRGSNGDHQGHSLQDKEKLSHGGLQQFLFSSLIGCLVITCPSCLFHVYSRIFLVCLYIEVVSHYVKGDYVDE